ncbi:MAG: hypothetical protein JWP58_1497 [Hymenobacter sp.]|nr:hypothetical protein [Hymenobacter sp.]
MKYTLLSGLLLLAGCGTTTPTTEAATPAAAAATPTAAAATPAAAAEKPATTALDLTAYGVPVVLTVPVGTTAKKDGVKGDEGGYVLINGPKLAMRAIARKKSEEEQRTGTDFAKKMVQAMGGKIEVNEPLTMLASIPTGPVKVSWAAAVPCSGGRYCDFSMQEGAIKLTEADQRAMFAIARTAKPTGK